MKTTLDVTFARQQFPTLSANPEWIFCDNAGGSLMAQTAIDRMHYALSNLRVQPYYRYPASIQAGELVDLSYQLFAESINADADEIVFNTSSSLNAYVLAQAIKKDLVPGDEIIVTNQDHETNIGYWRRLATPESGVIIKEWQVSAKTGELALDDLQELLTSKTKLVCVTHCSNILGHVNPIREIADLTHKIGARIIVDGVAYAPHAAIDVKALDVDFYFFSIYKTFGPHLGILYGKKEHLAKLSNQGHYFNDHFPRKRLTPSGPQHSEIIGALGIIDYYLMIFDHHFPDQKNRSLFEKITKIFALFHEHELQLAKKILDCLKQFPNVRILGQSEALLNKRFSVISFIVENMPSAAVVSQLIQHNVAATNSYYYAKRLLEALNINDMDDGVIRLSLLHYNTLDEVDKIISVLKKIIM